MGFCYLSKDKEKIEIPQYNLLDNSNFLNPINQLGFSSKATTDWEYCFDRWMGAGQEIALNEYGLILPSKCTIAQRMPLGTIGNKNILIIELANDQTIVFSKTFPDTINNISANVYTSTDNNYDCLSLTNYTNKELNIINMGLYKNIGIIPIYAPKNYSTELLECQRYLIPLCSGYTFSSSIAYNVIGSGFTLGTNTALISIPLPVAMRKTPTITFKYNNLNSVKIIFNGKMIPITKIDVVPFHPKQQGSGVTLCCTVSNVTNGYPCTLIGTLGAAPVLDANL